MELRNADFQHHRRRELKSVEDLRKDLRVLRNRKKPPVITSGTWFRGAPHGYPPRPTVGCPQKYAGEKLEKLDWIHERNLLHRFRRRVYLHLGRLLNSWEAIFLARHYLLPVRILDWTANPLVALWFACSSHPKRNAKVWCITRTKIEDYDLDVVDLGQRTEAESEGYGPLEIYTRYKITDAAIRDIKDLLGDVDWLDRLAELKEPEPQAGPAFLAGATGKLGPQELRTHRGVLLRVARVKDDRKVPRNTDDAVKILHPFYNSSRIIAQDGAFTFHSNPWMDLTKYANKKFAVDRLDIEGLMEWRIRKEHKIRILRELEALGIGRRTVFPDLDGLAKGLFESIVLNPQKEYSTS